MPWLGYFEKIAKADVFVFLDDVQYKKNEWQNRNRIKTAQGPQWLTVPVTYHFPEKITEVSVNNEQDWRKHQVHALTMNYSRAKYFDEVYHTLYADLYAREWKSLADLNIESIRKAMQYMGITTKTVRSSELKTSSTSTQRLIEICSQVGAECYIAGAGGKEYMDGSLFDAAKIKVVYQDFKHPAYPQLFGDFQPCLCVLDLLFNCGPKSREVLLSAAS